MIESPGIGLTLLAFLLVLGPLVFVHELGHYLVGRWCGVKADTFSVGFGKEVAGYTDKRGTRWKFGWMPLGGYVQFAGDMSPASQPDKIAPDVSPEERAQMFQTQPIWKRAAIVFAGPAINFIFAFLILMGFAVAYGQSTTSPVIGEVMPNSAAQQAGLKVGDEILAIDGNEVDTFDDIAQAVVLHAKKPISVRYERAGSEREVTFTLQELTEKDKFGNEFKRGAMGIKSNGIEVQPVSLLEAPAVAIKQIKGILNLMVEGLRQIVVGDRSIKEMGGPLQIAKQSGEQAALGWESLILFIALVSINLGFINLLPLPLLDGGHLLFYAIEAVRRKPASPKVQEWAFRMGFAAVATLFLVVTFNDLGSFGVWDRLAGLIG